ncbi:MAG: AtaL-like protein [Vogesella sp.]|uniref:AtaL-like protein n=1 Tax=Vogesella sp. TaxID=1904252 RepID=UPI00391C8B63
MKFEHLIKMFDELSPAPAITRRQLWQGLVLRAEDPCRFDENITEARVLSYENGSLRREVRFGELVVREHVGFVPEKSVIYQTEPSNQYPPSKLGMFIEEPQPGSLFIRFVYENDLPEDVVTNDTNDPAYYVPYLKSAYKQADLLTAERILALAHEGVLGSD